MNRSVPALGIVLVTCFTLPAPVWGHALKAKARVLTASVMVHAEYDDGTIARKAKVVVEDASHQPIELGETDARGEWSFARPKPGNYTITVNAGAGHLKTIDLTIPDPAQTPAKTEQAPHMDSDEEGSSRWLKLGIGLGVIALLGLAALAANRLRGSKESPRHDPH